ncbi:MAG: hypothetical protein N2578_06700, partial [Bdellovibrionaceae bacterium]|nr:hypothetical protein [Pseudobdellovibrionaceae bacterium]
MIKILFLCQMALSLSAAGDPGPFSSDYLVLRSQNFDVVVRKSDLEIGHHYVKVLERSHRLLAGLFLHPPPRTTVVLNPWQDITNGQAGVVPYPLITTFGTLPDNFGSLSETADWSLELLAHEYAHILSLEPATGAMRAFRHIFGSIISPNVLLPRWWKEGLSVLVESAVSPSGGRLRSLWQEATIRSLVMSERWEQLDIAGANEFIPQWPDGHRPYLLGSVFFARAQELHGHGVIGKLTLAHSSEVPYFLANPARSVLGVNYQDFYREAMQETSRRAWEQIITLRQEKVSSFHELPSPPEEQHFSPAFSSDGKYLAFVRLNRKGSRSLVIKKRPAEGGSFRAATQETWPTTTKQTEIKESRDYDGPPSGGLMGLAWMNKRNILIYDQSDSVDPWRVSSDLWLLDVESGRKEQLTYGLNAREPAVSPDDQKIVFIRNHFHKQGLEILDLESRSVETLYLGNIDERLSNPIFLGKDKILVARAVNAEESLWTFEIPLREWKKVLPEHAKARFPILTKKGLLFASAPNRVFNAWLATTDLKSAYPLTNTLDMIASPTLDPVTGELWLVRMSEFGPRLAVTEPAAKGELRLPHVTPIFTPPPLTDTKQTDSEPAVSYTHL